MSEDKLTRLSRIFSFEKKLREAKSLVEIRYTVTNELRNITPFVFAFFGEWKGKNKFKIETVSDVTVVERTSPTVSLIHFITHSLPSTTLISNSESLITTLPSFAAFAFSRVGAAVSGFFILM